MKVKVGNRIYDGEHEPVMAIFSEQDKKNLKILKNRCVRYCSAPDSMSDEEIEKWMNEGEKA